MTSRERILTALAHKEPDRVPIDFGAMRSTGIMAVAYYHLKHYLGIADGKIRIYDVGQQLAEPERPILERFHIDALDTNRTTDPALPAADPSQARDRWNSFELIDLLSKDRRIIEAEVPASFDIRPDGEGGYRIYDESGRIVSRKSSTSLYFDGCYYPLAEAQTVDDLKRLWPWEMPTKEYLASVRAHVKYLRENTDKALMLGFGGNILEKGQGLRGWEQFMIDVAMGGTFTETLLEMMTEHWIESLRLVLDSAGEYFDIIQMGDDMGTQEACQISPATYREKIFPCHKKIYQTIHDHPSHPYVFLHSCGSIEPLIPHIIDAGVQILNPVQTSAAGMEPEKLKKKYGDALTFWGGGCETQSTLPNGTPDEVAEQVKRRIEIFAPGGGFVFNQVHNVQANIPPLNVVAMFDAAYEYGKY